MCTRSLFACLIACLTFVFASPEVAGEDRTPPQSATHSAKQLTVAPVYTYERIVLSTSTARVTLTNQRGEIERFQILNQRAITLPEHLLPYGGARQATGALAVLDDFANQSAKGTGIHGWFRVWSEDKQIRLDSTELVPWTIVETSTSHVVLEYPRPPVVFRLEHRLDPQRPTLHSRFSIRSSSTTAADVQLILQPINGVHQDYSSGETYYLAGFSHAGGVPGGITNHGMPGTETEPLYIPNDVYDYLGVKTRFFAAWFTPGESPMSAKPEVNGTHIKDDNGDPNAQRPVSTGKPASPFTASLLLSQDPARHERQARLKIVWDKRILAPGGTIEQAWSTSVSSMTREDLANLSLIEQRIQYTDGFYRFFKVLAKGMTWLLTAIASVVVNYGLAVIVLTLLIKALMYRLTWKQYSSMLKMQKLAPEMKQVQEQYAGNKQQAAIKQMELFKKHGVNPLAGCLPLLIQMPIFMALYQAFCHSADLRGVSFLWISDLTLPDQVIGMPISFLDNWILSLNPLPIIYILVSVWMGFQQKPQPGADEMQVQMAKIMRWMPAVFGLIFYNMPSGLVLYFTVQAIISTFEIKYIKAKLGMA